MKESKEIKEAKLVWSREKKTLQDLLMNLDMIIFNRQDKCRMCEILPVFKYIIREDDFHPIWFCSDRCLFLYKLKGE
jgi:hypothetical protein